MKTSPGPAPSHSYLVVDGHSVIHAWQELSQWNRARGDSRQRAKDLLMQELRTYRDLSGDQVIAVFDGTGANVHEERETDGLQIFYGSRRQDADSIIERLAAGHARRVRFTVVTADTMVQRTVFSFGGDFISPTGLRERIDRLIKTFREDLKSRRRAQRTPGSK